jgi:Xaa-Pro dipeptidase
MNEAIERIHSMMQTEGYDAVVLKTRANFSWVTGGRDNHIVNASEFGVADVIVLPDRVVCVTNSIEQRRIAEEELQGLEFEIVAPNWADSVDHAMKRFLEGKRVGVDTYAPYGENIATKLSQLRRTLTDEQIVQYREVARHAAEAIEWTATQIQPGQTEYEIAALLAGEVIRRGCTPYVTLVATDARVFNYRHPIPTNKRLEKYAMLVICAEQYGLVANATRFVHFGDLPKELEENKHKCAYIDVRMNAATRPGQSVSTVFQTAIEAYREVGFSEDWKLLHQGGPTGFASREYLATLDAHDIIRANQAYAWNPAIPGIKSEDTILVGEHDNEFLTHTGNWPYLQVEYKGRVYRRPDILIRT